MSKSLYIDDLIPMITLSDFQKESISNLLSDIDNKILKLKFNNCLCKNQNVGNDIIISEKDRYGIPVKNLICSKCGLIRSEKIFDQESNINFYKYYYRNIYVGLSKPNEKFFDDQINRGVEFLTLLNKYIEIKDINNLLEIGCGSGGILYPFHKMKLSCTGVDYDEAYMEYGRLKGLSLIYGNYKNIIEDNSVDLLILSHVMEHFSNPIEDMINVINKVKSNKYLLVEVPGIFIINKIYLSPIYYLQNAHVFNYYFSYLKVFFENLGMEIIYGDERCTFILKKPEKWEIPEINSIYDDSLKIYPKIINSYIRKTFFQYKYSLSPYVWKIKLIKVLDYFGIKERIIRILQERK